MSIKRAVGILIASLLATAVLFGQVLAQESSPVVVETPIVTEAPIETETPIVTEAPIETEVPATVAPVETITVPASPEVTPTVPASPQTTLSAAALVGGFTNVAIREDTISGQQFTIDFSIAVPSTATAGDTLTITNASPNVVYPAGTFDLRDGNGNLVGIVTTTGSQATITLSEYVTSHFNVVASGFFTAQFGDLCHPEKTETVTFDTSNPQQFSDTVHRTDASCSQTHHLVKNGLAANENGTTRLRYWVHTGHQWVGTQTLEDNPGPGIAIDCSSVGLTNDPENSGVTLTIDSCSPTKLVWTVSGMTDGAVIHITADRTDAGPDYVNCASRVSEPDPDTQCWTISVQSGGEGGGTVVPTRVATNTPTATTEPTSTETTEPTATLTTEATATQTATTEPTATETAEPTSTATTEPTETATSEPSSTATAEPTETATVEPTSTATATATATTEPTATATATTEPTATATATTEPGQPTHTPAAPTNTPTATTAPGQPTHTPTKAPATTPVKTVPVSNLPSTGSGHDSSNGASFALLAGAILLGGVSLLTMRIRRR